MDAIDENALLKGAVDEGKIFRSHHLLSSKKYFQDDFLTHLELDNIFAP